MPTICPKDGKECVDDLCRGTGVCAITGGEMWDRCSRCHAVYSEEFGVDCDCEPCDEYDEDGPDDCA